MIINHNIAALNTYRQLSSVNNATSRSLEKLSSGLQINRAGDDAAGLAISEKMRGQIRGLEQATRNAQDGISMIQTAEGALNETHSILQRMRELAVQSGNDTNTSTDRDEIQKEVDQLAKELTRISNNTEFNTQSLLNGAIQSTGGIDAVTFQIGANASQNLSLEIGAMDASTLGVARDVASASVSGATDVDSAELSGTLGTAITDGATLTLSADATAAAGTTGAVGGLTVTTDSNTSELNGITISYSDGGNGVTESASYNTGTNTLTVTGDFTDDGTFSALAAIETAINNELSSSGFTATVTVAGTVSASTAGTSGDITGGLADDEVKLTIGSEDVIVKNDATSATFTSAANQGLTVNLDGTVTGSAAATITISVESSSAATFSGGEKTADATVAGGIDVSTKTAADSAITTIQSAIETVSAERSKLGAYQNRLEHTINNLGTSSENLTAAESRIRDVDYAEAA